MYTVDASDCLASPNTGTSLSPPSVLKFGPSQNIIMVPILNQSGVSYLHSLHTLFLGLMVLTWDPPESASPLSAGCLTCVLSKVLSAAPSQMPNCLAPSRCSINFCWITKWILYQVEVFQGFSLHFAFLTFMLCIERDQSKLHPNKNRWGRWSIFLVVWNLLYHL